ncbi:MAG: EAL and HDOD domain-containing protein [Acidiferrobacterales bacterium]
MVHNDRHANSSRKNLTAQGAETPSRAFLGRQPILDSKERLIAYELLFRHAEGATGAVIADEVQATSRLLVNTFSHFGIERVLGGKRAFINISAAMIDSGMIEALPSETFVLEILESVRPDGAVVDRCRELRAAGYELALDDFVYREDLEPLLSLATYVKLDVRALGVEGFAEQMKLLRARGLTVIAEKVETREEWRACRDLRVGGYQGYYFARPETLSMSRIDPSVQRLMQLFNLILGEADSALIEQEFKRDVALSFNLLRYINCVGFNLLHRVDSIKHALVVLGRARLARWVSLLLMSHSRGDQPLALYKTALVRARMIELLGRTHLPVAEHDFLFMTGMFSLLDVILGMPLADSLANLTLPQAVTDALLKDCGPYAPYLRLCRASEDPDHTVLSEVFRSAGVEPYEVSVVHLEALAWVEGLEEASV